MASRLLAQMRYFGSREDALPEWREAAKVKTSDDLWEIWPSLPIIAKAALNAHFEPVEMQRRFGLRGRISASGGSTGEPTRFFLDSPMLRASRGAHLYSQIKMGWRPGMPTIIVWGSDRDIGRQNSGWLRRTTQHLYRHHTIPGFAMSDRSVEEIHGFIKTEAPVAIYGYSSLLEFAAERTLSLGRQISPGSVAVAWNGGEMLYDSQVELFRRAFGVPVLNRYGGRELSVTAFQESEGAPLRVLRPWLFLEILNEAGKPAAVGEIGRLVLTSTICRGTPFIRYDIGDLGAYGAGDCDESGIRNIRTLHGRHSGSLRLQDGRVISCLYWNHLIKDYPEVAQFQVRVSADSRISLLLTGRGFSGVRAEQFKATLQLVLQGQHTELRWVETIPRTAQGKLLQVVHD
jgi:phenylacetate-CoA ligase